MNKELQHWLGSNRPPRVQITYDVETLGSTVQAEIPFVVGIMGDFVGDTVLPPMVRRAFTDIDRDNFATVMQGLAPTLQLTGMAAYTVVRTPEGPGVQVDPVVTDEFAPALSFNSVADFAPTSIIRQVPALQALMQTRQNLSDLLSKLDTNPSAQGSLTSGLAALAFTRAGVDLDAANSSLTTAATGTRAAFDKVATTVIGLENGDAGATQLTKAKAAVDTAVDAPTTGFAALYATAKSATATTADLQAAGNAAWAVAAALRDGVALLTAITNAYPPPPQDGSQPTDKEKARTDAEAVAIQAAAFMGLAGQAALSGGSAAAAAQLS